MGQLALELSCAVGCLVVDKTGIPGLFDIEFEYGPDENTPVSLGGAILAVTARFTHEAICLSARRPVWAPTTLPVRRFLRHWRSNSN
jgi:hypothetical protein